MTSLTVQVPRKVPTPRGAWVAAAAFARLLQVLHINRAARAERFERTRRESDASRVRRYAQQMMEQDPRFASDLFAAADRHERADLMGR
jgi:hypothetical protein